MSSPFAKYKVNSICNKSIRAFKKENCKSITPIILLIDDLILFDIYDFYNTVTLHVFHSCPIKNSCSSSETLQKFSPYSVNVARREISKTDTYLPNQSPLSPEISKIICNNNSNSSIYLHISRLVTKKKESL